jgi:hypothetical protein
VIRGVSVVGRESVARESGLEWRVISDVKASLSEIGVRRSYGRRRRIAVASLLLAAFTVTLVIVNRLIGPLDVVTRITGPVDVAARDGILAVFAFIALAAVATAMVAWGCPVCAGSLGLGFDPGHCRNCGVALSGMAIGDGAHDVAAEIPRIRRHRLGVWCVVIGALVVLLNGATLLIDAPWAFDAITGRARFGWIGFVGSLVWAAGCWLRCCVNCGASLRKATDPPFCRRCGAPVRKI